MPRLIDDIRAAGKLAMPWFVSSHEREWVRQAQLLSDLLHDPQLPVLLIDNVADYYFGSDQEHWDLVDDFPNLAPPFPQFWTEHRIPATIHSKERGDSDISRIIQRGRVGALITGLNPSEVKGEGLPENVRWILWCELFIDYGRLHDGTVDGPHGSTFLCIDEHGVLIGHPWMQSLSDPQHNEAMKAFMTWFNPSFLAMSFLHCKNVTIVEERMPKPLAKKFRAKHPGLEPAPYKTLVIEPLKQILRTQGGATDKGVGLKRAMHICRGHFKDYRQGPGLFGKYHQLVWQPSLVRGTKSGAAAPRQMEVKV